MSQIVYRINRFKQMMSVLIYVLVVVIFIYHLGLFIASGFDLGKAMHLEWFNEHFNMFGNITVKSLIGLVIWSGLAVPIICLSVFYSGLLINSLFFPSTFEHIRLISKEALSDKFCSNCNNRLSGLCISCPHCNANFTGES